MKTFLVGVAAAAAMIVGTIFALGLANVSTVHDTASADISVGQHHR